MNAHAALADVPLRLPRRAAGAWCATLIALPFLFPVTAGPSTSAWQQLASWACVALLLLAAPMAPPGRGIVFWLGAAALAVALRRGPDAGYVLGSVVALATMAAAAAVGAGLCGAGPRGATATIAGGAAAESGGGAIPAPLQAALAWGLLAAGLASAVLGLLQYYGAAGPLVPWTTAPSELGQAWGNLRQRNQFATLISMALVALLWLYAQPLRRRPRARAGLAAAGLALLLLAQAASTSRTGLLQWGSILAVAAAIAWRERRAQAGSGGAWPAAQETRSAAAPFRLPPPLLLLALIPLYFAAAWALPLLAGGDIEGMLRRLREGAPPGHSRLLLWRNVLALIGQHPWAGWGWGELGFAHFSTLYLQPRFVEILDNAHDLPLHLAVELGVPASLLLCGGFAWLVLAARPWAERSPARLLAWGVLGCIVLHSLLEYPLWYGPFQLVFGLCLGWLWPGVGPDVDADVSAQAGADHRVFKQKWAVAPVFSRLSAIFLLAIVGYAGWDYVRVSQIYLPQGERLPPWREQTLQKLQGSWLFAGQVQFAELVLTAATPASAVRVHALAERMLHYSPEPRVAAKLVDSALLLGHMDEAQAVALRFRIAFPEDYGRWVAGQPVDMPEPQ